MELCYYSCNLWFKALCLSKVAHFYPKSKKSSEYETPRHSLFPIARYFHFWGPNIFLSVPLSRCKYPCKTCGKTKGEFVCILK